MKRIISMISLVMCVMLLCSACSTGMTFRAFHRNTKYTDPAPALNSIENIPDLANTVYMGGYGYVMLFTDSATAKFYNVQSNEVLMQIDQSKLQYYAFFNVYGYDFFVVVEGAQAIGVPSPESFTVPDVPLKATIYDASGASVASTDDDWLKNLGSLSQVVSSQANLIQFGDTIYRVTKNGTLSEVLSNPFFGSIPNIAHYTKNYYYEINDRSVAVYDKELNCVFNWMPLQSDLAECTITPLTGDRLLIQQFYATADAESEYDVIMDDTKYSMESTIVDVKSGKSTARDLDYVLVSAKSTKDALSAWDAEYTLPGKIDTYAVIAMIEDRRVLDSSSALKSVSINKNGKVEFEIFSDLSGTTTLVADQRYLYQTYNGDRYLIDQKGNILSKINKISRFSTIQKNANYFLFDGKVYDYDLQPVYDYGTRNLSACQVMGHSILFIDDSGMLILFTGSGTTTAHEVGASIALSNNQFYVLQSPDFSHYTIFAEDGTKIGSDLTGSDLMLIRQMPECSIISTRNGEAQEYYKLFFTPGK